MFLKAFYLCIFISVTYETRLKYLPTSDDIRGSKVNYHRQVMCMLKVGQEICYNTTKTPGVPEEIADIIRVIKYGKEDRDLPGDNEGEVDLGDDGDDKADDSGDKADDGDDEADDNETILSEDADDDSGNERDDEGEGGGEDTY